jgi:hypothetical protein
MITKINHTCLPVQSLNRRAAPGQPSFKFAQPSTGGGLGPWAVPWPRPGAVGRGAGGGGGGGGGGGFKIFIFPGVG